MSAGAANQLTRTDVRIGGALASFIVTTGPLIGVNCSLDVDGNGGIDPLTDGLLLMRAMFGLTGAAVTGGAIGAMPSRSDWASIRTYLNGNCGTSFGP